MLSQPELQMKGLVFVMYNDNEFPISLPEGQNEPAPFPIEPILWGLWLIKVCLFMAQLSGLYDASMSEWLLAISSATVEVIAYILKKRYDNQNQ